jgi:hemin uptake protein HemP
MVKDETPTSGEMQPVPLHHAEALTLQGNTAQILLDGQVYTLRITRARKLILTKWPHPRRLLANPDPI